MAESSVVPARGGGGASLKDQGNEFFKAGSYLKAAALYTQAIKQDPNNPTLYSNRAAAFLNLVKLTKALTDAEMTISLSPNWEKGYFRKGCILEAMERYDEALDAFQVASQYNPQSTEVSKKIKKVSQLAKDKKRAEEVEQMRSNVDVAKHLSALKFELSEKYGGEECCRDVLSFLVETMENAIKTWHETSKVDPRVYFLLNNDKTDTEKYAPAVNIDKAFESPHTHSNCFSFLRDYAVDSFSKAACLITPKNIISYPQVLDDACIHRSGKVKDLGNGDRDKVMDSSYNLSLLLYVNCGLSLVPMRKDILYAGILRFWTLVPMKCFRVYSNKHRATPDNHHVSWLSHLSLEHDCNCGFYILWARTELQKLLEPGYDVWLLVWLVAYMMVPDLFSCIQELLSINVVYSCLFISLLQFNASC